MLKPLTALALFITPLAVGIPAVQAESWQDWVDSNPTYSSPASASPNNTSTLPAVPAKAQPAAPVPSRQNIPSPAAPTSQNSGQEYFSTKNPLFEQQFLTGCKADGLPVSYCQCALTEVQNNYTFNEVVTIVKFMESNREIPTELMNVAMKCLPG